MKRLNVKFLVILLAVVAAGAVGVVLLQQFQVRRNADQLVKRAKLRLEEGKQAEAIGLLGRYLSLRPADASAQAQYAQLLLKRAQGRGATRNDVAAAFDSLEKAVRLDPNNAAVRYDLADFQLTIGRYGDAREHLQFLLDRAPDAAAPAAGETPEKARDVESLTLMLARSYLGTGDFNDAAEAVAGLIGFDFQARRFDPEKKRSATNPTDGFILLATIFDDRLRDRDTAGTIYDEMVKERGDDPRAWYAISRWHRENGELQKARADIARAETMAPDEPDTVFAAFELATATRDYEAAGRLAARALELFPDDERAFRAAAAVALERRDAAGAEKVLRDAIAAVPSKASLMLMLADALLQQGKVDESAETLAQLKELYGSASPPVGVMEGRILIARKEWLPARKKFEEVRPQAAGMDELTRQIDLCLAQCFEALGEFDEQLEVNRRVLADDPNSLAARAGAAVALAAGGQQADALREFEAIAKGLSAEQLAREPQIWQPLFQLRVLAQGGVPEAERDWSGAEAIITMLRESGTVGDAQLALLRSDLLVRQGEADVAIDLLERQLADAGPALPQVAAALAGIMLRQRGPAAARAVLDGVPDEADQPSVMIASAQVAAAEGPAGDAEFAAIEKRAAALAPADTGRVLAMIAGLRLDRGDVAEAVRLLERVVTIQPNDLRSRWTLFEVAMTGGDVEKAREAAAAIGKEAGSTNARARVVEAGVRILEVRNARREADAPAELTVQQQRALEEARTLLTEAENERAGWYLVQALFAEVDLLEGKTQAAVDRLLQASRLSPGNAAIARQLVPLLYQTGRLDDARRELSSLGPRGVGLERVAAELALRDGRLDEAVANASRAVPGDASNPRDLLWLAQVLDKAGRKDQARAALDRAAEVAPGEPDVWLALLAAALNAGDKQSAAAVLQRADAALPEPNRRLVMAQGYEMLDRLGDADRLLEEAVAADPDNPVVQQARATFLSRSGRFDEAVTVLRGILDRNGVPATLQTWARRALAELLAKRGTYTDLEQALALLDGDADGSGSIENVSLEVSLLVERPEPASWREAVARIEKLAATQPLTVSQRLTLAQLYDRVGRWDDCRGELMTLVGGPEAPLIYVALLIEKLLAHDDVATARTLLRRLQQAAPDEPATLALQAKLAIATGDRPTAVEAAKKLMPDGSRPQDLAAVAALMEDLGFTKAADRVFEQLAAESPNGILLRARFLARQQRGEEACDLVDGLRSSLPTTTVLGVAITAAGDLTDPSGVTPRLADWITKARREDPASIQLALLAAELCRLEGRPDDAESLYRELLAREPLAPSDRAIVANNLAYALAKPETATEARALIDEAIAFMGPHPDLLDTRGLVHLALGDVDQALADLAEAALKPSDAKLLHLAWAQLQKGDRAAAERSLRAARKQRLQRSRLSTADRKRLDELEAVFGVAEQAAADAPRAPLAGGQP